MRINFVLPQANLSGGVKANRIVADRLVALGHEVYITYPRAGEFWPRPWRIRTFARHAMNVWRRRDAAHHLEGAAAHLIETPGPGIRADEAPNADICIATFWMTREWIESWPLEKGLQAYFVRHHEIYSWAPDRVAATYRLAGQKFVVARWLQRVMQEEYGDSTAVLAPDAVDRGHFFGPPRDRQPAPTVGMMYSRKGWKGSQTAFDALRIVQTALPTVRVVAFGEQSLSQGHVPPRNFELHVSPAQATISEICRSVDCWLLPSTTEGFGLPGLEAAACRCPVVATRCGGPEDYVVDGKTGWLTPVGDAAQMADRLLRILNLPASEWKAMSEASYARSLEFDWDRTAKIVEQTLLGMLAKSSSASLATVQEPRLTRPPTAIQ